MQVIKVGDLVERQDGKLFYIVSEMFDSFFCMDFETEQQSLTISEPEIKQVIQLPKNISFLWVKRVERIMKGAL